MANFESLIFQTIFAIFRKVMKLMNVSNPSTDGLSSIAPLYQIIQYEQRPLYTWILCDVFMEQEVKDMGIPEKTPQKRKKIRKKKS